VRAPRFHFGERIDLRKAIAIIAVCLAGSVGWTADAPQKTAAQKKSTQSQSTRKKSAQKKSTQTPSTAHKTAVTAGQKAASSQRAKRSAHGAPARSWRAGQTAPTPDRYKEIQAALAKKGYLHGEPNGKWDDESADALRRFQKDQNLQPNGKLDSLSIIALGLGPKYDASADKPAAPPPQPQP
jgi:hypothetical protein